MNFLSLSIHSVKEAIKYCAIDAIVPKTRKCQLKENISYQVFTVIRGIGAHVKKTVINKKNLRPQTSDSCSENENKNMNIENNE